MKARGFYKSAVSTAVLIAAIAAPAMAAAQTGEVAADGFAEGDIIVTARRQAESIQTVPIAITALTADDLARRNISNLNDLTNTTPGVAITSIAGGTLTNIYIRGQAPANTTTDLNVEANVGVFIDDIYQTSRNTLDIISVLDVGQIEIAKGPQSALFGRSTFAGAMSISTRPPSEELEGNIQATAGTDDDYRVRGSISVPLGETLSARIAGGYLTYGGYGENSAEPGNKLGGTEKYAVTASLLFKPTDEFTAKLSGFVSHSKSELTPASVLPLGAFNCGSLSGGVRTVYCGSLTAPEVSSLTAGAPDTVAKARQVALSMSWSRSGVSITSTTGFTEAENDTLNDYDGSGPGTVFGVCTGGAACLGVPAYSRLVRANMLSIGRERVRTFSQEVRVQSDNDSPLEWIFGGSYFNSRIPLAAGGIGVSAGPLAANERLVQVSQLTTPPTSGTGMGYDFTANPFLVADQNATQVSASYTAASTQTMSIFGSLGYSFGDLRVRGEGRYNIDRKRARTFSVSNPTSQPGVNAVIDGTNVPAAGVFPVVSPLFARTFESFAPRFTIDFKAAQDIFLYVTAAKGVRSGGFNTVNPVSATGILADEVAYEEETNWTYEAGVKSRLFDRKLMFNASVFHIDWKNAQVSAFTNNPGAVNPARIVRNAGNIKTTGVEAQAEVSITDYFKLGGSVVYSDPKFQAGAYDGSIITQCVIGTGAAAVAAPGCPPVILVTTAAGPRALPSLEGKRPQRSVKLQWNANASLDVPLSGDWRLFGRVDVSHTGDAYSNLPNTISFGERTLTSARISVENERFSVAVWANNIFDVNYVSNSINQPRAGLPFVFSVPEIYLGEKRRVGVTVGAKF